MILITAITIIYLIGCFFTFLRLCQLFRPTNDNDDLWYGDKIIIITMTLFSWVMFFVFLLGYIIILDFDGPYFRFGWNEKEWFSKEKTKENKDSEPDFGKLNW